MEELGKEDSFTLLEKISNVLDLERGFLVLSGGEPLLRRDITDLISFSRDLGMKIIVISNGILLDDSILQFFERKEVGVDISFDAATSSTYGSIRGVSGAYERIVRNVMKCVERDLLESIITLVLKLNMNEIPLIIDMMASVGVNRIILDSLKPMGKALEAYWKLSPSPSEYNMLLKRVCENSLELEDYIDIYVLDPFFTLISDKYCHTTLRDRESYICGCGIGRALYVSPLGDIKPCVFFPFTVGNIMELEVEEVWNTVLSNDVVKNILNVNKLEDPCKRCKYRDICRGGCRVRAYILTGSWFKPDPQCPLANPNTIRAKPI